METNTKHNRHNTILVIGDIIIDKYLYATETKTNPESEIPLYIISDIKTKKGGAGNVSEKIQKYGCKSVLYNDNLELTKLSVKTRIIHDNKQVMRYDKDVIIQFFDEFSISDICELLDNDYQAVIISDYAKGMISESLSKYIIIKCNNKHVPVYVDPKGRDYTKYKGAYCITPNWKEAQEATGRDDILSALLYFKNDIKIKHPIITKDADGIYYLNNTNELKNAPAKKVQCVDVTGCGDAVIASIACDITNGIDFDTAVYNANYRASEVIQRIGT